ncbi:hypothetical protein CMTB2_00059 [Caminibacter mediatlanticus TB-2]|uniref:Uncharacterized protein n=1 Tax=Caminibacter mediatlanticus TB-2 TaxID=391592 RepID=A0AAI9AGH0_9BACT|nr:hypothetical protein CMTB2_00059 [Caminibacter mediatlanticus TB-2]
MKSIEKMGVVNIFKVTNLFGISIIKKTD